MYWVPPFFLISVGLLSLFYLLFLTATPTKVPQIRREEVNPSGLFAKFESLYPKEEKTEKSLPSIKLIATVTGSVRMALAEVDGSPRTLRVGSQVSAYRVVSIERNYLILVKGEDRLAIGFRFSQESAPDASYSPAKPLPTPQASKSVQSAISKGELERITADPGIMFRQIRLVPFVQEGRTRGFLFEWVEPGSLFERAGIRAGDVLLSINNQEIRSGEDAFRILQVLRNESSIRLNIQRGNEILEISLRVE
ncbi:MAG: PDZ domain-containing protein [Aquificaceae bacterium]|nr:PDZ domain-containing protein [Aquificaceae bacterium]MDW8422926.1 PDZ domain-containing protein [Aquificaceae bacterium]